jgi:lysophospholipase L1-like esterase
MTGCTNSVPTLNALSQDAVILAFGDSLTAGTGAPEGESYPMLLAKRLGHTVINAGMAGERSDQALAQILGESRLKSDLVHPNAQGYEQLAEAIGRLLKAAGAVQSF